ncbi:MAG: oxygen-independent coproporphyrinogen-3 oxidase [Cellvibrionaceae bacterium]|jgi:oxygen-independent coproporphyrinogen-3 oxidase
MKKQSLLSLPPLALYVHIPWCIKKCPYCDFNSHTSNNIPEEAYTNRLIEDLQQQLPDLAGRKLHSIFFGGGTPSLFSAHSIEKILNTAEKLIGFAPKIEITLEANPGTFEQDKFTDFFKAGANRLSIGIQSFNPGHLKALGRVHSSDEAIRSLDIAKKAGFNNINIDIMHGLPQQTVADASADIDRALSLEPQHISWYQLTIEPNTVFYKQPPPLPADEQLADIQDAGMYLLAEHGYRQYEVSAFSQPSLQSKHNTNYWSFGDYMGIGAGAHGKFTDIANQQIIRRQKTRTPEDYLNQNSNKNISTANNTAPSFKDTIIPQDELILEFLMNALRLNNGVPKNIFESYTGLPQQVLENALEPLIRQGLIEPIDPQIKTTELGQRFLNTVLTRLSS